MMPGLQFLMSGEAFGSGEKYYLIFVLYLVFLKIFEPLDYCISKQPGLFLI